MTVYASDAEWDDAARAAIFIAGTIAGLFFVPEITAPIVIGALVDVGINSVTIGKYIYENSDGTYTISPEFVQAVMDAAQRLEDQGFNNYSSLKNSLGRYEYRGASTFIENQPARDSFSVTYSLESEKRLVCVDGTAWHINSDGSLSNSYDFDYKMYRNGQYYTSGRRSVWYWFNDSAVLEFSLGMNMPMYNTMDEAKVAVSSGDYSDALNYRERQIFRRHSSYTPTYSGGAVTVNRTVIENISQKIVEVDEDASLTDDQKIEELQEYIRTGGNTGGGGTGGGSGDTDYEDNKDLPAGTDLTDTNSWLKKIYLKVCQIYDRMNLAVEDAEQTALAKIQESLDEIIVQLKKIKRWTAVDTVIDGVDAIGDWLDLIRGVISDVEEGTGSAVAAISSAVGDSVDQMTKKFPFSIPWDLFFLISFFSAEPEVPHFEIPFRVPYYDLEYTFVIDFTDYQWLSDLIRPILLMIYATGLLSKTPSILSIGKEE